MSASSESPPAAPRPAARRAPPSRGWPAVSACACPRCAAARRPARPTRCGCADDPAAARWRLATTASASAPGSSTSTACTRSSRRPRHADDRRLAHARLLVEHALDVFGKDVQPLGRDDHFLLAALDEHAPLRVALADVAGVQPAVRVERAARAPRRAVAARALSPGSSRRSRSRRARGSRRRRRCCTSTPAIGVPTDPLLVLNG